MIIESKRQDFGNKIQPSSYFNEENYKGKKYCNETDQYPIVVNKRYNKDISWIQETYPPIYNFQNQKIGSFTATLQLDGYEYDQSHYNNNHHNYNNKNKINPNSYFIDQQQYEDEVKNRFNKPSENPQKEYIRPLISFKHYDKFIENNTIQTITDKNNRDKLTQSQSVLPNIQYNHMFQKEQKGKTYNKSLVNQIDKSNLKYNSSSNLLKQQQQQQSQNSHLNNNIYINGNNNQDDKTIKQINNNNNINVLNNENKLTLKDPHLNYIANNIDTLSQKINKYVISSI